MFPCEPAFAWLRAYDFYFLKKRDFFIKKASVLSSNITGIGKNRCSKLLTRLVLCSSQQLLGLRHVTPSAEWQRHLFLASLAPFFISLLKSYSALSWFDYERCPPIDSHIMCFAPNWWRYLEKIEKS